jgi:pimeloyl-ACP methyl ester carboxylesterase
MVDLRFKQRLRTRRLKTFSSNYQSLSNVLCGLPAMTEPTLSYVTCPDAAGEHRMAYWQWGQPDSGHVVVCVHGLTRQGRDFDVLAQALCEQASAQPGGIRVVCPDVVGRGESDWLRDPMGYQVPTYVADMLVLLAHLHAESPMTALDWVGTSMGGLIGMAVCGQPALNFATSPQDVGGQFPAGPPQGKLAPSGGSALREATSVGAMPPVRRLVLNDVGPSLQWRAIVRIGAYLGEAGHFSTVQDASDAMGAVSQSFGPHTPEQWLALSRPMVKPVSAAADSKWRLHYDPAIAVPFKLATEASAQQDEATLWQLYDHIKAETLLIRGALSDLLSPETARAMTERGPQARLVEFEGVGHAPTLIAKDQVAAVAGFLLG